MVESERLFLDTEFDGFGGELISLALVAESGPEWYEVQSVPPSPHPWVAEHVIPKLYARPIGAAEFRHRLHSFLRQFDRPTIVCDWHADAEHFCASLAGDDYGTSLDYPCVIVLLAGPSDVRPLDPHNALSDARALREWYNRCRS